MKVLKAFVKPFEVPTRKAKKKWKLIFISRQLSEMHGKGYHQSIRLTIEINPIKILDTKLNWLNDIYKTTVYQKTTNLPTYWSSNVPKRYKYHATFGDLHRAKRISKDFNEEVNYIIDNFQKALYRLRFINNIVNDFIKSTAWKTRKMHILLHPLHSKTKNLSFWLKFHFGIEMWRGGKTLLENFMNLLTINSKYQRNELQKKSSKVFSTKG